MELRGGYWANDWRRGRLTVRPQLVLAWRNAKLNDFYYGTSDYHAGAGLDLQAALYASYALTESWNLIGGLNPTPRSSQISGMPLAPGGPHSTALFGFFYDFSATPCRCAPALHCPRQ